MRLTIPAIREGRLIPDKYAFCIPASSEDGHVTMGRNYNPEIRWSDLPIGTRSMALLMVDPDSPASQEGVNEEGAVIPVDRERTDFYHWVAVDIPPAPSHIKVGADADGVTPRGKSVGQADYGMRGLNSYTTWFSGDADMEGVYGGYDGPCPPWNDERMHHYHFRLFALNVSSLNLSGAFTGDDVLEAIEGHILAEDKHVGLYTLNPQLR